jgi:hypothetical protein
LIPLGSLFPGLGATVSWDGGGDGVSWNQTANWSNNTLPTASDDALISGLSTKVTIVISANVTVQSLHAAPR